MQFRVCLYALTNCAYSDAYLPCEPRASPPWIGSTAGSGSACASALGALGAVEVPRGVTCCACTAGCASLTGLGSFELLGVFLPKLPCKVNASHCLLTGTGGFPPAVSAASSAVVSSELVEVVEVPLRDTIVLDHELQEALVGKRSMTSTLAESEHIDLLFLMDGSVERLVDFLPPLCPLLLPDHVLQVEGEPTNVVTRRLIDRGVPSSAAVQEDDALGCSRAAAGSWHAGSPAGCPRAWGLPA